jgi:ATP-dependent 26S proteasome regulatory subunit
MKLTLDYRHYQMLLSAYSMWIEEQRKLQKTLEANVNEPFIVKDYHKLSHAANMVIKNQQDIAVVTDVMEAIKNDDVNFAKKLALRINPIHTITLMALHDYGNELYELLTTFDPDGDYSTNQFVEPAPVGITALEAFHYRLRNLVEQYVDYRLFVAWVDSLP